ncbi:zf-HC2 domain-containing protein [Oscillospiraceae bacterium CM]|nr:zf-HC2 domain-containing protein [Oscillospiraceae bacterium CM]
MADCKKMRDLVSAFADNALTDLEKEELCAHLDGCASCRALLSTVQSIARATDVQTDVPETLVSSVMARIKKAPGAAPASTRTPLNRLKPALFSAATLAACLALMLFVFPNLDGLFDMPWKAVPILSSENSGTASEGNPQTSENTGASDMSLMMTPASDAAAEPLDGAAEKYTAAAPAATDTASYYATFTIKGQLPALLEKYTMTDNQDGTYSIEIPAATAEQLIKSGYPAEMGDTALAMALVIYKP